MTLGKLEFPPSASTFAYDPDPRWMSQGGGKKKKVMKGHTAHTEVAKGPGALTKQETAKMLSKALKVRAVISYSIRCIHAF